MRCSSIVAVIRGAGGSRAHFRAARHLEPGCESLLSLPSPPFRVLPVFLMASMCTVHGVVDILKGQLEVFEYAEKKTYWSHDAFLPLPDSEDDFAFTVFTFGRKPLPLYDGIYIISGRVMQARSALSSKSSVAPVSHVFVCRAVVPCSISLADHHFHLGTY